MKIYKIIIAGLVFTAFLTSCSKMAISTNSTYPELNGSYTYYSYTSWNEGLYEILIYDSWDFDKTARARNFYKRWSYTEEGWTNALKESNTIMREWKVESGTFYTKIWDYDMEWVAHSFEYINESSFKLDGNLYEKDK